MVTIMSENFAPMRTGTYPRKATMTRILIVEDEESYREPLVYQLTREGYDVSAAATGEEGLELFTKGGIDLVLLDLMLPGIDGTALCRRIREQSRVPIIMLTAKSAEIDKVVGLEIGADDYVTKPYSFRELLARIRAVMRRNQATAQASGTVDDDIPLVCGDIAMQVGQHQVTVRGETVFFPLKEFELLEYLMQNKGRVMTRHQLIDRIWGSDYVGDTKTLDVHVKRVRSKIEEDPGHPQVSDYRARSRIQDRYSRGVNGRRPSGRLFCCASGLPQASPLQKLRSLNVAHKHPSVHLLFTDFGFGPLKPPIRL